VVDEQRDDLAAQFIAFNGGQAAKGADQIVGQLRRNVRLFRSVMHSFSPLRFDLAKQMAFAMSHAAVSISPLEKNLHPASEFTDLHCVAFRDAPAHHVYVAFRDMPHAKRVKRPTFNPVIFGAIIAFHAVSTWCTT
jgi:hypothetical protein